MKKKILFIVICLLMMTGCNDQKSNENKTPDDTLMLELVKTAGCNNQVSEYYQKSGQDRKVYFVCLDEIYISRENTKQMTLEYHFDNVNQSFDASIEQLINQMEMVSAYKDGGTVLYQKDDYRMLVCKKEGGSRDVYFGDITLEYENDYCVYK